MAHLFKGSDVNSELYPLPQPARRFARSDERPVVDDVQLEETATNLERTVDAAKALAPAIEQLTGLVHSAAREEGYREGLVRAQTELHRSMVEAMATLTAAQRERERIAEINREGLADLALTIARRVIGEHLAADPEIVARIVADTIRELEPSMNVQVRVHPADLDAVERHKEDLDRLVTDGTTQIVPDATVDRGGCVIVSPAGDVDARIATKLSVLETAFAAQRRHVEGTGA